MKNVLFFLGVFIVVVMGLGLSFGIYGRVAHVAIADTTYGYIVLSTLLLTIVATIVKVKMKNK